jgi:hypothetical protein
MPADAFVLFYEFRHNGELITDIHLRRQTTVSRLLIEVP